MKDVTTYEVYEMATSWPAKLITAEEAAAETGVLAEHLLAWATQGICPHFRINGGVPQFRLSDLKKWMIAARVLEECLGSAKPENFTLRIISDKPNVDDLPLELRSVGRVFDVSRNLLPTGVYFLYLGDRLQYIGQSVEPATRLSQHRHSGKAFDRAFVIPVPAFMLDNVEGALIRYFRPPLNGNTAPIGDGKHEDTLAELGIIERILDGEIIEEQA